MARDTRRRKRIVGALVDRGIPVIQTVSVTQPHEWIFLSDSPERR
jgi:hypothetical protein